MNTFKTLVLLFLSGFLLKNCVTSEGQSNAQKDKRPNIVVILDSLKVFKKRGLNVAV